MALSAGGADGPKLAWGVRKVHAHRAATLWPGEDAVAVLDYEAEGWPPAALRGIMARPTRWSDGL
jgi:hypothetical protein